MSQSLLIFAQHTWPPRVRTTHFLIFLPSCTLRLAVAGASEHPYFYPQRKGVSAPRSRGAVHTCTTKFRGQTLVPWPENPVCESEPCRQGRGESTC